MWRSTIGYDEIAKTVSKEDDDWETDPDFIVSFGFLPPLSTLDCKCL